MWTDEQLDRAQYVEFRDPETKQEFGVGTIEILTGANQGVYFMKPTPPFGSLSNDSSTANGMKLGASVPGAQVTIQHTPRGLPVPDRPPSDQYVIHDYGKPHL